MILLNFERSLKPTSYCNRRCSELHCMHRRSLSAFSIPRRNGDRFGASVVVIAGKVVAIFGIGTVVDDVEDALDMVAKGILVLLVVWWTRRHCCCVHRQ